ncbi:MAG: tetratricopeptide repeat protein, partial [Gammaproteobacteria bacterium]|nr:tetratricopeptide repeat protein [Gammaproteobacteria bacterium]
FGPSLSEQRTEVRLRREQEINETIGSRMIDLERAQITRSLEEGKSLLAQGDYQNALSRFEITLLWEPENEEARALATTCRYEQSTGEVRAAMDQDDYAGALIHLRKALRHVPGDSTTLALIDVCEQRIAEAENSVTMVTQLLKTAIDLYAERRFTDALSGFEEVLKIDPRNTLAKEYRTKCQVNIRSIVQRHTINANSLADRGKFTDAIRLLEQALDFDPTNTSIPTSIDRYKKLLQQTKTAETTTSKPEPAPRKTQVTRPPVNRPLLERKYTQGMSAFNDGKFSEAIKSFSEVWAHDPAFHNVSSLLIKAYLFVGMNYYSDQNYSDAIRIWERALVVDPNNSKAKRYLSKANEELRRLDDVNIRN